VSHWAGTRPRPHRLRCCLRRPRCPERHRPGHRGRTAANGLRAGRHPADRL